MTREEMSAEIRGIIPELTMGDSVEPLVALMVQIQRITGFDTAPGSVIDVVNGRASPAQHEEWVRLLRLAKGGCKMVTGIYQAYPYYEGHALMTFLSAIEYAGQCLEADDETIARLSSKNEMFGIGLAFWRQDAEWWQPGLGIR